MSVGSISHALPDICVHVQVTSRCYYRYFTCCGKYFRSRLSLVPKTPFPFPFQTPATQATVDPILCFQESKGKR